MTDGHRYVGVGARSIAQLIDFLVLGISVLLIGFMADLTGAVHQFAPVVVWALFMFLPAAYFIGLEAELGATAGKWMMSQRVVMEDGSPMTWRASVIRNALRPVDGIFFYLVGAVLVWSSDRRQRLGDRVAGTLVVRKASLEEVPAPPISAREAAPITTGSAPGRWWYALAGLVLVAGLATAGVLAFRVADELPRALTRVVVPGQTELALNEPGAYTIYHEYRTVVDGRVYSTGGELSSLQVTVETFDGRPVTLDSPGGTFEYSIGGRSGVAVLTFRAQEPGTYRMSAHYPAGEGPEAVLAVGRGWDRDILVGFLAAIGIALLAGAGALAITIITFLKRGKARQRVGAEMQRFENRLLIGLTVLALSAVACTGGSEVTTTSEATTTSFGAAAPAGTNEEGGERIPQRWTGTMLSEATQTAPGVHCVSVWEGSVDFAVDQDQAVSGEGHVNLIDGPDCNFDYRGTPITVVRFGIRGHRDDGQFLLHLELVDYNPGDDAGGWLAGHFEPLHQGTPVGQEFVVPITRPGVIEEQVSLPWSIPDSGGEVVDTFDLTCQTCEEESD